MASLNKVMLIGHVGVSPEIKTVAGGTSICNFTVATNEKRGKEKKEHTEWHRVVCFGELAGNVAKYVSKGSQVFVEGRIQTRSWEKNGEKKYATEILADRVLFMGGKRDGNELRSDAAGDSGVSRGVGQGAGENAQGNDDDDVPF